MALPAAAARIPGTLAYDLTIKEVGSWRVSVADGRARVDQVSDSDGRSDFRLTTDAKGFVDLATGNASPLGLMLRGRLRIRGKRRRVRKLRHMAGPEPTLADVVAAGGSVDPGPMIEALPYLIEPEWTKGHSFTVAYDIEGAGRWAIQARDGEPVALLDEASPDATVRLSLDTYTRMAAGQLTPDQAMQSQLTDVDGQLYPVTLLGRWIDRSAGDDDAELEREAAQREVQQRRSAMRVPAEGELLGYRQLYRLWERQQWLSTDLDFSLDQEHWLATPAAAQENTIWSMGSFYVGEERVTADLAPFLAAAPNGEVELFLATQLVDEARHAAFFDRFGAEVMALDAEDLRGRMQEVSQRLTSAWTTVFDDGLRGVAQRIQAKPDDLDLFVEGITTYHLVIEGLLATTGQKFIRDYLLEHGLYPGFCEGFGLVERDEHRHIAFGMRFLKDAIEQDTRYARTIERTVLELAPKASYVFVPPYATDPREFTSYGYHSSEIYGYAYRTLKRRMGVLGLQIPPAEELMPGPVAKADALPAAPLDQAVGFSQNGEGRQSDAQHRDADPREHESLEPGIG
jgi:ribonucleoside-diphosphate reductase beta chain